MASTVRALASHPAVLMFAVGNEIPPSVVRWHGQARIERFLRDLYDAGKQAVARQPPDLRQLPADRVPGPRLLRRVQLQRLPAPRSRPPRLSRAAAACRRRQAVPAGGSRGRQPARGSRAARPASPPCTSGPRSRKAPAARWRSPGPTSGGAAATRWTTGRFGLVDKARQPKPALAGGVAGVCRGAVHVRRAGAAGRRSRWWSAPTTPRTRSTTAWPR